MASPRRGHSRKSKRWPPIKHAAPPCVSVSHWADTTDTRTREDTHFSRAQGDTIPRPPPAHSAAIGSQRRRLVTFDAQSRPLHRHRHRPLRGPRRRGRQAGPTLDTQYDPRAVQRTTTPTSQRSLARRYKSGIHIGVQNSPDTVRVDASKSRQQGGPIDVLE